MQKKGSILGLSSGFLWGLDTVILGIALALSSMTVLGTSSSLIATLLHDGISFLFLIILIIKLNKNKEFFRVIKSKAGLSIIIAALLGGPLGMGAYILSIRYLGASLASSFSAIYPAVGALLAFVFLKERMKLHSIIGLGLAIFAIALMGLSSTMEVSNLILGMFFLAICVLGWGSEAVIINAALKEDVSSEVALAIRQMTSSLVYLTLVLPFIGFDIFFEVAKHSNVILIIFLSGLMGTLSYLCYYKSIDLIGATQAMGLNISYPAWAFLFQYLYDGTFSLLMFVLVIIIMIGSIMSNDKPQELLGLFKTKE